jgi:hypothetical protein
MDCGVMVSHAVPVLVYRSPGPVIGRDHSTVSEGSPRLLIASCGRDCRRIRQVGHGRCQKKNSLAVLVAGVPSSKRVTVVH